MSQNSQLLDRDANVTFKGILCEVGLVPQYHVDPPEATVSH